MYIYIPITIDTTDNFFDGATLGKGYTDPWDALYALKQANEHWVLCGFMGDPETDYVAFQGNMVDIWWEDVEGDRYDSNDYGDFVDGILRIEVEE